MLLSEPSVIEIRSSFLLIEQCDSEIVKGLNPGKPYDLSIIAIGCKENDTQETDPIQVKTDSFEPANFQLEKDEYIKLGKLFLLVIAIVV